MSCVHGRLLIGACASVMALAGGMAPSAQAAATGMCVGNTVTVTINGAVAPFPTTVSVAGTVVTINGATLNASTVNCPAPVTVIINGDGLGNQVSYDGTVGGTVTANL